MTSFKEKDKERSLTQWTVKAMSWGESGLSTTITRSCLRPNIANPFDDTLFCVVWAISYYEILKLDRAQCMFFT